MTWADIGIDIVDMVNIVDIDGDIDDINSKNHWLTLIPRF